MNRYYFSQMVFRIVTNIDFHVSPFPNDHPTNKTRSRYDGGTRLSVHSW